MLRAVEVGLTPTRSTRLAQWRPPDYTRFAGPRMKLFAEDSAGPGTGPHPTGVAFLIGGSDPT
jgi:hypothetical protein